MKKIPPLSAFIFDMDGVLIDSLSLDLLVVNDILQKQFQTEVSKAFIRTIFAYSIPQFWRKVFEETKVQVTEDIFQGIVSSYDDLRKNTAFPLLPGVEDLLSQIKGRKPIGVASNNRDESIEKILEQCGIRKYFDIIVGNDHIVSRKPAPDIYLLAARRLGFEPSSCIAFEDSDLGVRSAKSAGCFTVAVATGGLSKEELKEFHPDDILDDLTQFTFNDAV